MDNNDPRLHGHGLLFIEHRSELDYDLVLDGTSVGTLTRERRVTDGVIYNRWAAADNTGFFVAEHDDLGVVMAAAGRVLVPETRPANVRWFTRLLRRLGVRRHG